MPDEKNAAIRSGLIAAFRDFVIGLRLFVLVSFSYAATASTGPRALDADRLAAVEALMGDPSAWHGAAPAIYGTELAAQAAARPEGSDLVILALALASIFAFNLWFYRHLRREYASPRRGGRGRG